MLEFRDLLRNTATGEFVMPMAVAGAGVCSF
jgi:hypothetical protein